MPLAAVFAAVYGLLRLVPISVWIGVPGRVFTATEFMAPLFGLLLGPYGGSIAAIVGTFVAIILTGRMNFFGLDFLPAMTNALVLGLMVWNRRVLSILLYSLLLVLFFVHPMTLNFVSIPFWNGVPVPFVWLHLIAWVLLVSPLGGKSVEWIQDRAHWKAVCSAFVLALIGSTAQHLTGTILFATVAVPLMGITPEALRASWTAIFYVYPVERLIVLFFATMVVAGITRALIAAGMIRGPTRTTSSTARGGVGTLHE